MKAVVRISDPIFRNLPVYTLAGTLQSPEMPVQNVLFPDGEI